ncbi:hypothetical protein T07_1977, partial [Trichinella nelsoni]
LDLTFAADAMVFTIHRSLVRLRLGGPNVRAKTRFRPRA